MSSHNVLPYTGPYELKFSIDNPEFWDEYLKFKRYFYLAHCFDVDLRKFADAMREFCTTDDPDRFDELYIGLHFIITFNLLNPDLRAKYAEGVNKVQIEHTLEEIIALVHSFGHHLDVSIMGTGSRLLLQGIIARAGVLPQTSHQIIVISSSESTGQWRRMIESSRETAQLVNSLPSPKDAKKARRQHIREMQIRTGQRKR